MQSLLPDTRETILASEAATRDLAQMLAPLLVSLQPLRLDLIGGLGAGKTTFVRHLLRHMGVQGRIKSPTYALLESYELPHLEIFHFDLYRLETPHEWLESGLQDILNGPGLKLLEWPQQAGTLLGPPDLCLCLDFVPGDETTRRARLSAHNSHGARLLAAPAFSL